MRPSDSTKISVTEEEQIIFYDGDCPLCNRSVQFVLNRNASKNLMCAPLNGATARALLPESLVGSDTIVLLRKNKLYTYSSAVIRTIALANGLYKGAMVLLIVPKFLRDWVYKPTARNRRRLMKKGCDVSTGVHKERVLP